VSLPVQRLGAMGSRLAVLTPKGGVELPNSDRAAIYDQPGRFTPPGKRIGIPVQLDLSDLNPPSQAPSVRKDGRTRCRLRQGKLAREPLCL
jgi:hypothetical protein